MLYLDFTEADGEGFRLRLNTTAQVRGEVKKLIKNEIKVLQAQGATGFKLVRGSYYN